MRSVAAIAARAGVNLSAPQRDPRGAGFAEAPAAAGMTSPRTMSSDDTIRDEPAMKPRASATIAEHSAQSRACASTRAASSGGSSPSSHAWMVPSSRCDMTTPPT